MPEATNNKHIIQHALAELARTGDAAVLDPLLHADFIHHRPDMTRTKAEWLQAVRAVPLPELRVQVHHLLEDGPYVVMCSKRWLASGGPEITGVDIWRVEDGLIREAWETLETSTSAPANMKWYERLDE